MHLNSGCYEKPREVTICLNVVAKGSLATDNAEPFSSFGIKSFNFNNLALHFQQKTLQTKDRDILWG